MTIESILLSIGACIILGLLGRVVLYVNNWFTLRRARAQQRRHYDREIKRWADHRRVRRKR